MTLAMVTNTERTEAHTGKIPNTVNIGAGNPEQTHIHATILRKREGTIREHMERILLELQARRKNFCPAVCAKRSHLMMFTASELPYA